MKKKILVVADSASPLTRARGLYADPGKYDVYWYDWRGNVEGIPVKGAAGAPSRNKALAALLSPLALLRYIRQVRPDIIHVFWAIQHLDTFPLLRFRPMVLSVMGGDIMPDQCYRGAAKTWLVRKLLEHADIITSKSAFMDDALIRIGGYKGKIRRITWGVKSVSGATINYHHLFQRHNLPENAAIFFCARRAYPLYNKEKVVEAFARLAREMPDAFLLASEFDPDLQTLRRMHEIAQREGCAERIRFLATIPADEMSAYYRLSHFLVSVPNSDGMPQSLYEAMNCGSFPLLGDLPQYHEIIEHKKNGYLAELTAEGIYRGMKWCYENRGNLEDAKRINLEKIQQLGNQDAEREKMNAIYDELTGIAGRK